MSKKTCSYLWVADVPDTPIDEVVMNVNKTYENEEVIFISAVRVIERLIDADKDKEARQGKCERVLEKMSCLLRRDCW